MKCRPLHAFGPVSLLGQVCAGNSSGSLMECPDMSMSLATCGLLWHFHHIASPLIFTLKYYKCVIHGVELPGKCHSKMPICNFHTVPLQLDRMSQKAVFRQHESMLLCAVCARLSSAKPKMALMTTAPHGGGHLFGCKQA